MLVLQRVSFTSVDIFSISNNMKTLVIDVYPWSIYLIRLSRDVEYCKSLIFSDFTLLSV